MFCLIAMRIIYVLGIYNVIGSLTSWLGYIVTRSHEMTSDFRPPCKRTCAVIAGRKVNKEQPLGVVRMLSTPLRPSQIIPSSTSELIFAAHTTGV